MKKTLMITAGILILSVGVAYADALAPAGMGATAQGIFVAVIFGFGTATGALLGGLLYDTVGGAAMFAVAGFVVLAGLLYYAVAGRESPVD